MSHTQIIVFCIILLLLILLSAFFSCAETALMAINRYRLRHKARMKKRYAVLILSLLKRPDRLLGMILIGNNFLNILASALATLIAVHLWGEAGVIISTAILTILILVFAEVAPKTLAALYPEKVAKIVTLPIYYMLKICYPMVWLVNTISNALLLLLRVRVSGQIAEPLTREELRSVVYETAGRISHPYQTMLLGILDLNKSSVDDVMIPQHEIIGIDLEDSWEKVRNEIANSEVNWLPVYRESINQVIGILYLRDIAQLLLENQELNKETLLKHLHEPYFIPEGTPLNIQLVNFQQKRRRFALIVDEYGEIQGLVTLEDILEEIVGEFTTNVVGVSKINLQPDGSYLADGAITVREFNRLTQWQLPLRGPRTLNGLIIEQLEVIPVTGVCVKIAEYPIEIIQVKDNRVKTARVFPQMKTESIE